MRTRLFIATISFFIVFAIGWNTALAQRPSLRDVKKQAEDVMKQEIDAKRNFREPLEWKHFQWEVENISFEYPDEWDFKFQNDHESKNSRYYRASEGDYVALYEETYTENVIFVAKKNLDHAVAMKDLEKDFEEQIRQPDNSFELKHLPFLRELKVLSTKQTEFQGKPVLETEQTFIYASKPRHSRELRIAWGHAIYYLEYRAHAGEFDNDLEIFEHLHSSLQLPPIASNGEEIDVDSKKDDSPVFGNVAGSSFVDVLPSNPFYEAINLLHNEGIIKGNPDGTYRPDHSINRAEFTKIIVEAIADEALVESHCFPDVSDEWFAAYICYAKKKGLITGYPNGTFQPTNNVSLAEAAKILVYASAIAVSPAEGQSWFMPYIDALLDRNAIPATLVNPAKNITRGEMAEMIYRLRGVLGITH